MGFTLCGLLLLSAARQLSMRCSLSAALVGLGSAVFHPESSRVARMASGGRHGLAQSLFQVGGNTGSAIGPLVAAFIVLPRGPVERRLVLVAALLAIAVLWQVGPLVSARSAPVAAHSAPAPATARPALLAGQGAPGARRADRADLLQVLLPGEHHQLLHVLPDPPLRRLGAERPAPPLRSSSARWRPARSSADRSATASAGST